MSRRRKRIGLALALVVATAASPTAQATAPVVDGSSQSLRVSLKPSTLIATTTNSFIPYVLHVWDENADSLEISIAWSDGSVMQFSEETLCAPSSAGGGIDRSYDLPHSFRHPGAQQVIITVQTDGCDAQAETASVTASALVGPGDITSNGPQLPRFIVQSFRRDRKQPLKVGTDLVLLDPDGWPNSVEVDWGDGRTSRYGQPQCSDPLIRYPAGRIVAGPVHEYRRAGKFTVTFTGRSAGCDGQHGQPTQHKVQVKVSRH